MKKLLKLIKFIDKNILKWFFVGFIFFAPLWPKIPIKIINYTYIALRADDIYLSILTSIFFIQLLRKKVVLEKRFFILFSIFWIFVFSSFLWNIYISKNIEYPHLGFLHSLRRIEYMIVFFIAYSLVKTKKDFFEIIKYFFIAVWLVVLYGIGQKFLNFPAVQTMNPEFAKGYLLYLTPEARISSTFAGHYDLASFLVFSIPIILSFYFLFNQKKYLFLFILSLIILIYTASRISFGAYIIAVFSFLFFIKKYKFSIFVIILTILLMLTTGELTKRFLKTFQIRTILVDEKTGAVYIGQKITTKELPAGSFYIKLKDQNKEIKNEINLNEFKQKIVEEKLKEATLSGKISNINKEEFITTISANLKPVNTVVSDISFATRLQVEWPRAINAFKKNPFLGTGPSSITEATDNDYLRWLGEFGFFGTLSFLIIIFNIIKKTFFSIKKKLDKNNFPFIGFTFGLGALLINASYIDVFEASKVAYTFWIIAGLFIAFRNLSFKNEKN
ncbi:MAG: O-antigen ligase family protein [Patescibacteria group bacterium]|nr:O-antigen ligase family protein [Patescibacteria group bacterium]